MKTVQARSPAKTQAQNHLANVKFRGAASSLFFEDSSHLKTLFWSVCCFFLLILSAGCNKQTYSSPKVPTKENLVITSNFSEKLQIVMASTDLSVGENRIAFGIINPSSGMIRDAAVEISTFYLKNPDTQMPKQTVAATFQKWPVGAGGIYTAQLIFDNPGYWGLSLLVNDQEGFIQNGSIKLLVEEHSNSPMVGSLAPLSLNKTLDVDYLEDITSDTNPDPELYSMNISTAIDTGQPLLVVFSTPAYCLTSTCGPQLDVVKRIKEQYKSDMNFIHVEVYDNLTEMHEDFSKARQSPVFAEWNLKTEPWTFIVDRKGIIFAKFEGYATSKELTNEIMAVLR